MIPDYNQFFSESVGWSDEVSASLANASGIVSGTNPPWGPADFLAIHPKFGGPGPVLYVQGTLASASPVVTNTATAGMAPGELVAGPGVPLGSTIFSVDSPSQFTLNHNATAEGTVTLTLYNTSATLVPLAVLNAYIALASASLVQARWRDAWPIAMDLYVAHYCTLWLRSDGDIYSTPGQAAAAGLTRGITVSKSAGGVSLGIQPVTGIENWGAWQETSYGEQFASLAKLVGAGPILLW